MEDLPDNGLIHDGYNCEANYIAILPNGDVYACRRMYSKVRNVLEEEMEEIFLRVAEEDYKNVWKLGKYSKCRLLRFYRDCLTVAEAVTGSCLSADHQCWVDVDFDMYRTEAGQ